MLPLTLNQRAWRLLTNSGHVARGEVVFREAKQDATLAYRGVPDDYELY